MLSMSEMVMKFEEEDLVVSKIDVELNKKVLLTLFCVTGLSILLSGCLAYLFSDSLFTIFCGLVFGVTLGVLINYLIIVTNKIVKDIKIEFSTSGTAEDELQTVMKIE